MGSSVIPPAWAMRGGLDIECVPESLSFSLHFSPGIRFIKKLEHTWKALVHDGVSVGTSRTCPALPALASFTRVGAGYLAIYRA